MYNITEIMNSDLETQILIDASLSNVIILERICKFSSSPKTLRLVAKGWNNVILSGKSPPLSLNLVSLPPGENREEFEALLNSMDSRLFKRCNMSILNIASAAVSEQEALQKLVHFCEGQGSDIHEFYVTWWPGIVPTLYRLLGGGYCPNLKTLEIKVKSQNGDIIFHPFLREEDEWPKTQTLSKLINIKFIYTWPKGEDQIPTPMLVTSFLDDLLKASPNLQKLAVKSFFCPGLDSNKNLKEFRYHCNPKNMPWRNKAVPITDFNYKNLSDILEQVKGSLEVFEITSMAKQEPYLKIPVLPKLRTFLCRDVVSEFGIRPNLKQLMREKMPSLVHLSIPLYGGEDNMNGSDVLDNLLLLQNTNIKSLDLTGVTLESGDMFIEKFAGLKKPFPFLERLEVPLWKSGEGVAVGLGREECGKFVGRTLEFCSSLGLLDLQIKTSFCYSMSGLVNGMWNCRQELFSGLKTLKIINLHFPDTLVSDDLTPEGINQLEEVLLMGKGMRDLVFGGFLLQFHHNKRLSEFISDNKLPVRFLY